MSEEKIEMKKPEKRIEQELVRLLELTWKLEQEMGKIVLKH
jgi:hypothetical protein